MIVGVTGHRRLADEGWVGEAIGAVLSQVPRPLVGISSLASGADQLFAGLVLALGGELRAVLPFPEYEEDFAPGVERDRYRALLARAAHVEVLAEQPTKPESYLAAGKRVVDLSDLVVAVWDGKAGKGVGGTADAVRYARATGTSVLHVDPVRPSGCWSRGYERRNMPSTTRPISQLPERLRSLDVLRGATIAAMILVNNAGDWDKTYRPLLHAEWHGWTPTDLVFPFFLFAVGVAIPYAFAGRLARSGGDRGPLHRQLARRTLILFALGLFLNWFPFYTVDWPAARIPGVLQRIAVVYLAAALAWLHLTPRSRAALALGLLAAYWLAMVLVPVPGHGAGDLSPDGNLAAWIDRLLLGRHTWRRAPGPGDPEGILSTVPAIVTALAGLFAADWLRSARTPRAKLRGLLVAGCLATVAGLTLDPWLPINKNLWTSTYVLFTAGAALLLLAAVYYLVDVKQRDGWARPFSIFGTNAIAAFFGSTLLAKILLLSRWQAAPGETVTLQAWLYRGLFSSWLPDYVASLAWALAFVALWWGLLAVLYRRRIFIKV